MRYREAEHGFVCVQVEERRDWVRVMFRRMEPHRTQYMTAYGPAKQAGRYKVGERYQMLVSPLSSFVPEEKAQDAVAPYGWQPYFDPLRHEQCR